MSFKIHDPFFLELFNSQYSNTAVDNVCAKSQRTNYEKQTLLPFPELKLKSKIEIEIKIKI